jgi:hypothetical protein
MTMTTRTSTLSRRGWLSRLLMAAVVPVVSVTMTETVDASKKDKERQKAAKRVEKQSRTEAQFCRDQRGTPTTSKNAGGTTVRCEIPGEGNDYSCTFTKQKKVPRCFGIPERTTPIAPGDGGSTPPIGSPVDGGGTAPPPPTCTLKPLGGSCSTGGECCSGGCNGQCCLPDGSACVNPGDCCGGICSGGICSSLT